MIATDDLRIPTVSREAAIEFKDSILIPGLVFIPTAAPDHAGAMRLVEWLNDDAQFFPFKAHGDDAPIIVNKGGVLSLTAYHNRDSGDYDEIDEARRITVCVETSFNKYEGQMIVDMPQNRNRALDVLNNGSRFVFLLSDGREIHVNKKFINKVMEIERV